MKTRILMALSLVAILSACGKQDPVATTAGTAGPAGAGGCVPINTMIGFTGTSNYFSDVKIMGGIIPNTGFGGGLPTNGSGLGQVIVGGGGVGGPYQRTGVDGSISMNVTPINNGQGGFGGGFGGFGGPVSVNTQGMIQISQATQQDIIMSQGGGYYFPPNGGFPGQQPGANPNVPAVCVSQIAFDLGHYNTLIYGGNVYLYLNNTQHGYVLYF